MNKHGFTLIEVLITIAILSILLALAGYSYTTFMSRYRLEGQVREMYADLMNARARALQRNLDHFVVISSNTFRVIEDANDNGTQDDATLTEKVLPFFATATTEVTMNKRGLVSDNITIQFNSESINAAYDCLVLQTTRIRMGKWNGTSCVSQ